MNDERRHDHDVLAADHDHTRHEGEVHALPGNPDLRQLRAQAKDLRRGVHTPASLELAVSAAASIVSAAWRRKGQLRLITTGAVDSGFSSGHAHTDAIRAIGVINAQ